MSTAKKLHKRARRKVRGDAEREAMDSVTPEQFTKGGLEMGAKYDMLPGSEVRTTKSVYFIRKAPVKPLERLVRPQGRRDHPFLEVHHIQAANLYHTDLMAGQSVGSCELKEAVDSTPEPDRHQLHLMDCAMRLGQIRLRLAHDEMAVLDVVFDAQNFDKPMTEIWPNKAARRCKCKVLKKALHNLAWVYGLVSSKGSENGSH